MLFAWRRSTINALKKIEINNEQKNIKNKEIYELKREIKNIENDLRFYNNLLK